MDEAIHAKSTVSIGDHCKDAQNCPKMLILTKNNYGCISSTSGPGKCKFNGQGARVGYIKFSTIDPSKILMYKNGNGDFLNGTYQVRQAADNYLS